MPRADLDIEHTQDGARTVLTVRGEIDLATAAELSAALEQGAGGDVVLDLREVGFMDSTGLTALVRAHQALDRLTVICSDGPARRALEVSGLMAVLNVEPSPA